MKKENIEAWILKLIGLGLAITSALDFFGFLPLPKSGAIPPVWQLTVAFAVGIGLVITPVDTLQGWYNAFIGRKINKV